MRSTPPVRRSPTATYIGSGLAVIGLALLWLTWADDRPPGEVIGHVPLLLAAAVIGFALVVVGVVIVLIETMRRDARRGAIEVGRLTASLAALNGHLAPRLATGTGPGAYRPRPRGSRADDGGHDAGSTGGRQPTLDVPPAPGAIGESGRSRA